MPIVKYCMFWRSRKTISFRQVRKVLVALLRDIRCLDWSQRVSNANSANFKCLLADEENLLQSIACRKNSHSVLKSREQLAETLGNCLIRLAAAASERGDLRLTAALRVCFPDSCQVTVWRCASCDSRQIKEYQLKALCARIAVEKSMILGIALKKPASTILDMWEFYNDSSELERLRQLSIKKGLEVSLPSSDTCLCGKCRGVVVSDWLWDGHC